MISKESIKYSLNNIRKSKTRSALTVLSVFVGIATIFIFISFGIGLYNYTNKFTSSSSADKILISPKGANMAGVGGISKLSDRDIRTIKQTAGVYAATGVYINVAEITQKNKKRYAAVMGYDPEIPLMIELSNIKIAKGRALQRSDSGKVILGYNYMIKNKIFPKAYSINSKINVQGQDLRVVGFYGKVGNPQDDSNIYINSNFIQKLYPEKNLSYNFIIARVNIEDIQSIVDKVKEKLRRERHLKKGEEDFTVQSYMDLIKSFTTVLDIIVGFIILIAFISIVVSAVNSANTMISSILERFKEIGILKSIGARNSEIFKIFLFESGFLGSIAGIIGVIVGFGATNIGAKILDNFGYGFLSPSYPWFLFVGLILFATLTGVVSGIIPAWKASRINVVEALRYE